MPQRATAELKKSLEKLAYQMKIKKSNLEIKQKKFPVLHCV
jgi:hypothetical protein